MNNEKSCCNRIRTYFIIRNRFRRSWKKLIAGETGIDLITSYDTTDQPVRIAGEVKGFEPTDYGIEKKEVKKLARNTQFALVATKMALDDANFKNR